MRVRLDSSTSRPRREAVLLILTAVVAVGLFRAPQAMADVPVGSASMGSTAYAVPGNAVFARAGGGTGGDGTLSSPYQSAQTAVSKAPNGATVVLRGGSYRELLTVPFNKRLVIQSYPHEAVWFDGSGPVSGWVKSGSTWVVSNWKYIFDDKVSLTPGKNESSRFVDPAYPMAGYSDGVWIDGVEQTQVASAGAVTAGKFYVDRTNKRLVIGSDPTGRLVEASKLTKAMVLQGAGTTIRGIGVRRFATPVSGQGAISYQVNDLTFENVVVADNATIGIFGWGDRATFRNVTVSGNGLLGLHGDSAPGLTITRSLIQNNNDQHFRETPVSAGVKVSNSDGVKVTDSVFAGNKTTGLWFDISVRNVKITGNRIVDNGSAGLEYELSARAIIAGNYVARNAGAGIFLFDSNDVQIWNNTLDRNNRSVQVLQDERRQSNSALKATVPWVTSDIDVSDNVIAYGSNSCPILTQDLTKKWTGNAFDIASNGNVFHRPSRTSPSRFACWANGSAGTKSFSDLNGWRAGTGNDKASRLYEGTAVLTSTGALTSAVASQTGSVPLALPSDVAAAAARNAGERSLGAYLVR